MEMATTPGVLSAVWTAAKRLAELLESSVASKRMMLAIGAIAWAHSMSIDSSLSQESLGSTPGRVVPPVWLSCWNVGLPLPELNMGSPKYEEKAFRSLRAVG